MRPRYGCAKLSHRWICNKRAVRPSYWPSVGSATSGLFFHPTWPRVLSSSSGPLRWLVDVDVPLTLGRLVMTCSRVQGVYPSDREIAVFGVFNLTGFVRRSGDWLGWMFWVVPWHFACDIGSTVACKYGSVMRRTQPLQVHGNQRMCQGSVVVSLVGFG